MFGRSAKLPISEEDRQWVNEGFRRLDNLVGRRRMLDAKVVEPTAEDFPDPYDRSPAAVESLFARVCAYMWVDRRTIELEIFPDETEELREMLPSWRGGGGNRAAGLYLHAQNRDGVNDDSKGRMHVALRSSLQKIPWCWWRPQLTSLDM